MFYFPCSICKVEPSEIIEQAITLLMEGCSFGTLESNPQLVKYLTSTWCYCYHKLHNYKGSFTNPKLIVTTISLSLLSLCEGAGAPCLRCSSAGLFSSCYPSTKPVRRHVREVPSSSFAVKPMITVLSSGFSCLTNSSLKPLTVTEPSFGMVEFLFFSVEVKCCQRSILLSLLAVGFLLYVDGCLIAAGGRVSIKSSGKKEYCKSSSIYCSFQS